jgi:hypothetical protein
MDLILIDDSCVGGTGVGNDINVLELQMGLLKGEGNGGEGDPGGKFNAVVALFFGSGNQLPVNKDGGSRVGMKEIETQNVHRGAPDFDRRVSRFTFQFLQTFLL